MKKFNLFLLMMTLSSQLISNVLADEVPVPNDITDKITKAQNLLIERLVKVSGGVEQVKDDIAYSDDGKLAGFVELDAHLFGPGDGNDPEYAEIVPFSVRLNTEGKIQVSLGLLKGRLDPYSEFNFLRYEGVYNENGENYHKSTLASYDKEGRIWSDGSGYISLIGGASLYHEAFDGLEESNKERVSDLFVHLKAGIGFGYKFSSKDLFYANIAYENDQNTGYQGASKKNYRGEGSEGIVAQVGYKRQLKDNSYFNVFLKSDFRDHQYKNLSTGETFDLQNKFNAPNVLNVEYKF